LNEVKKVKPKPRGKKQPKKPLPTVEKLICRECEKELVLTNFYNTNSTFSKTGKFEICKKCLMAKVDITDIHSIYNILQLMDIPFIIDVWETTELSFGNYLRMVNSLTQYKGMTWKDSVFEYEKEDIRQGVNRKTKFELTDDIVDFFGAGYEEKEYEAMFKKYNFLKNNYQETTNMHTEALKTYVRYRIKEEFATARGDATDAKKWGEMASKGATDAKINPSQMSKSDLQGGLSNFSELIKSVESAVDIIKILPKFKYIPQDSPDFIIFCYVNYVRDLKGLPPAKYEDIYKFYDDKKAEYLGQYGDPYGIFEGDLDLRNRDSISKFVMDVVSEITVEENSPEDLFEGEENGIS